MRALAFVSMLALAGCASSPDPTVLCGTWANEDTREQWWIDGEGLRGEGRLIRGDSEVVTETLALRRSRDGHVYVAKPGEAEPTEFVPIDPRAARFGPEDAGRDLDALRFSWANYEHDFPQEIHYLLVDDRLTAVVSGPGNQLRFDFTRSSPCTKSP